MESSPSVFSASVGLCACDLTRRLLGRLHAFAASKGHSTTLSLAFGTHDAFSADTPGTKNETVDGLQDRSHDCVTRQDIALI